jgi:hypothetical protein
LAQTSVILYLYIGSLFRPAPTARPPNVASARPADRCGREAAAAALPGGTFAGAV